MPGQMMYHQLRPAQLMPLLGVLGVVVASIAVLIYAFHKSSKPPLTHMMKA